MPSADLHRTSGRRRQLAALAAGAAIAPLLLAGCGGDDDSAGGATSLVEGVESPVQAIDNSFRPEEVTVAAGTEVVWTNDGRNEHNVLPADEAESWGVQVTDFEPGDEYRHRFTEPGTYAYYCSLHGTKDKGMVGTIVVTDGAEG